MILEGPNGYQWLAAGFALGFVSYLIIKEYAFLSPKNWQSFKFVMVVRTDINFGKAETAEFCSQVTLENYRQVMKTSPQFIKAWERNSQPKITVKLDKDFEKEAWLLKEKAENIGLVAVALKQKNALAVVGIGPGPEDLVNQVTGHLKLLG